MDIMKKLIKRIRISCKSFVYAKCYFAGNLYLKMYNGESYAEALARALPTYLSSQEINDKSNLKHLVRLAIKSNLLFGFKPHEFFMYDLAEKKVSEWGTYLAEKDRVGTLHKFFGKELKAQLRDKWLFYQLAKPFFKREIFHFTKDTTLEEFASFVNRIKHVFCKPADGHMGMGVERFDVESEADAKNLFDHLAAVGTDWVVEECIRQGKEMAAWNESSVNTIRFPAFYRNGVLTPYYPRIRVGRKGQIVDNVAQGGLIAFVDAKTGVINTDGFFKKNEISKDHPDSRIVFKGTQIPHWADLLKYAEDLHKALPQHVYIAWDFAYTENGWDVVEANWGQMDSTQMIIGHGIRKEFHELLGR